jgi:hypothetical protein
VDAVLGLSMTPTAVGLVLVEGQDGDGATVDREAFEMPVRDSADVVQTSEKVAAAVLRSEAIAATRGHRLHSIGVTWSDDAGAEASLVMKSLTESGFDNVVPVRLPEATEALARGIADVVGYDTTAVCVIEPETVIALVVHTHDGGVQTAVNHGIDGDRSLIGWLSTVFTRAGWQPEALVVVGSAVGLDAIMPQLEEALAVPVFAPAEAELALARGAALASAHPAEFGFPDRGGASGQDRSTSTRRRMIRAAPLVMLAAGAVTFVVSVSLWVGLQLKPESGPPQPAATSMPSPPAVQPLPPALPPVAIPPSPVADVPASEEPEAPAVDVTPTEDVSADPPADIGEPPVDTDAPPPLADTPVAPPQLENTVSGTGAKPPLLTRILGHLPGLHNDPDPVQRAPTQVPPPVPPVQ